MCCLHFNLNMCPPSGPPLPFSLIEAARFRPLALRSNTSKSKGLQWIRDDIKGWVVASPVHV